MIETQLQATAAISAVLGGRSLTRALDQVRARKGELQWGVLQDVCFGVLRHLGLLRGTLRASTRKPLADLDVEVLLLVALYQLQFTRAPAHAVVDQAVQACVRLHKASAKGLVNGVLRNFLRGPEALLTLARRTEEARWSYPQWWIDQVRQHYPDCFEAVLDAGNARPPMTLRVNLRRITRDDYLALLESDGLPAEAIGLAAVQLAQPVAVDRLPGFRAGLVSVQDLSAQYAQGLLDCASGQRVLDACAAPGGKSAHLLEGTDLDLTAIDSDPERLERVRETLQRLELSATLVCADASEPSTWWDGRPFERILLDAPCTATGIVRRHPDIKWLRRPEDTAALAVQQRRLLEALWRTLAAGGKLLYATCSIFPAENQLQVAAFLQAHPEAKLLPLSGFPVGPTIGNIPGQILPDPRHDGFFYVLLQKA